MKLLRPMQRGHIFDALQSFLHLHLLIIGSRLISLLRKVLEEDDKFQLFRKSQSIVRYK